ncbi:glycosyltransferase family 4 protein [Paenibacillus paeoniae]|uniref:Glycosyltransferase n=1 Tax=Paenibacillus paeoniae TaxID=2292705 RepID=A0A371P1U6_9BACL|nr:glycosyltransferase family 4 protein [Paenibacillus paeoniae]REK69276.1 glycosyltransferase [Paenibacillus paeoniae]
MNKKIVILRSNPVDPDSRVEKEANTLLTNGHDVTIVAWERGAKHKAREEKIRLFSKEVSIHRMGIPAKFGGGMKKNLIPLLLFQYYLMLWLIRNRKSYDIIHACDFDTALSAFLCAKFLKKKLVYDIFDYYVDAFSVPTKLKRYIQKIDHHIINSASATIICSEKRKDQISGSSPKSLTFIHNTPPDLELGKYKFNLNQNKMKLVYVGILSKERFLLEISEVIQKLPNCELHIGGFGELGSYFEQLSAISENIHFYGKLSYEKSLNLAYNCDIMLAIYDPSIPNHKYAAPNKFYEALMLGKPLIMVENTGMDEVVLRNEIGVVIKYNKNSFAENLQSLIRKQADWPGMSERMKMLYKGKYSWSIMEKRLINLYEQI